MEGRKAGWNSSKFLAVVLAEKHPRVKEWPEFVHSVETNRIFISPELELAMSQAILQVHQERSSPNPPQRANPCDFCGKPTGNWLYDACRPCVVQALVAVRTNDSRPQN